MTLRQPFLISLVFHLMLIGPSQPHACAAGRRLHDADNDGIFTVMDLSRQFAAMSGRGTLPATERTYAESTATVCSTSSTAPQPSNSNAQLMVSC